MVFRGTPSAELPPDPAEATEADAKFMEDVTTVLRSDRDEAALSSDGVCLFLGTRVVRKYCNSQ